MNTPTGTLSELRNFDLPRLPKLRIHDHARNIIECILLLTLYLRAQFRISIRPIIQRNNTQLIPLNPKKPPFQQRPPAPQILHLTHNSNLPANPNRSQKRRSQVLVRAKPGEESWSGHRSQKHRTEIVYDRCCADAVKIVAAVA